MGKRQELEAELSLAVLRHETDLSSAATSSEAALGALQLQVAELTTERDQAMQETKQVSLELEEALNVADAEAETTQHML